MVMLLREQPPCNHSIGGGTASAIANSPFQNVLIREAERDGGRCNLYCLTAVVEWFYCEIDPTDHLISSLSTTIAAK